MEKPCRSVLNASLRCISWLPPAVTHMDTDIHPSNARTYQVPSPALPPRHTINFPQHFACCHVAALALWLTLNGFLSTPRRNQKRIRRFASGNCTTSCWARSWLALRAIGLPRSPRTLGFNDAVHQKKPAFDPFPGPVIQSHVCRSVRSGAAGAVLEQLLHQMFPSPTQTRLTSTPPPLQRPILRPTGQSVENAPVASLGVARACLGLLGLPLGVPGALHDPQQRRPFLGAPMAPIRVAVCTKPTWPYHRTPVSPSPHPLRRRASFPRRAKGGCGDSGGLQL